METFSIKRFASEFTSAVSYAKKSSARTHSSMDKTKATFEAWSSFQTTTLLFFFFFNCWQALLEPGVKPSF